MAIQLKVATDHLFDTFHKYTILGNLRERSCNCCVSDNEIKDLLSKSLRQLTEEDLRHFMASAICTFGDIEDYKHFLPRILELMQYPKSDFLEDFLIYEKLNYSEWETWDIEEIKAIDSYFLTLWTEKIKNSDTSFYEIQALFDIIEKYVGVEKGLKIWEEYASNQSLLFVVDFVWNNYNLKNNKTTDLLYAFFSKSAIKEKIADLYFGIKDEILAMRISVVYTILDNHDN